MACLGVEAGAAGWMVQTNPLSYGGTPWACSYHVEQIENNLNISLQLIATVADDIKHYNWLKIVTWFARANKSALFHHSVATLLLN